MQMFIHPISGKVVFGHRITPTIALEVGDVYDSSGGDWAPCPSPGLTIELGCTTVWVRKQQELSAEAAALLRLLTHPANSFRYVVEDLDGAYRFVLWARNYYSPHPNFQPPVVEHYTAVAELHRNLYLEHNRHLGYDIYSLTEAGKEVGAELNTKMQ